MSGTALDHPLIRDYLRELNAALSGAPPGQARELREQITAHLEDALPAGASDQEVAGTLGRLGSPASLAAEAGAEAPFRSPADKTRAAFARRSGRFWAVLAGTVFLVGLVTAYVVAVLTAGVLQTGGGEGWWYKQDAARGVITSADGATQNTVPIRPGQRQGYYLHLYNPSDWTQTVLGPADKPLISPGSLFAQLGVSAGDRLKDYGFGIPQDVRYGLPRDIPPHQWRTLRVLWTSHFCIEKGGLEGVDGLVLKVRVGWTVRTETIPLDQGFYLSGATGAGCPP
jgi:hypothetical protein